MTNDFSGGLRGLRPPATFLQPFGLRWETNNWGQETSSPFANDIFLGEEEETVETVPSLFMRLRVTGLKPGVNETRVSRTIFD
jgi:hypothetical protein